MNIIMEYFMYKHVTIISWPISIATFFFLIVIFFKVVYPFLFFPKNLSTYCKNITVMGKI